MDNEKLILQIQALLKIAKIEQVEKDSLLSKLPTSNLDQLDRLRVNLLRQVAVDIYLDALEDVQQDDSLIDEEMVEVIENKIIAKFDETEAVVLTDTELSDIRQNIQTLQQKTVTSPQMPVANNPSVAPTVPATIPLVNQDTKPATTPQPPQTTVS